LKHEHCSAKKAITTGEANAPKKILIVGDEPTILLTLSYALRSRDGEVVTASRFKPADEVLELHSTW